MPKFNMGNSNLVLTGIHEPIDPVQIHSYRRFLIRTYFGFFGSRRKSHSDILIMSNTLSLMAQGVAYFMDLFSVQKHFSVKKSCCRDKPGPNFSMFPVKKLSDKSPFSTECSKIRCVRLIKMLGGCSIENNSCDDKIGLMVRIVCILVLCVCVSVSWILCRPCSFFFLWAEAFFVRVGWRISINIRAASCYSARPIPKKRKRREELSTRSLFFSLRENNLRVCGV